MGDPIPLANLPRAEVPAAMRVETYFDLDAHPFWHEALFQREDVNCVCMAIRAIDPYVTNWLEEQLPALRSEKQVTVYTDSVPGATCTGQFEIVLEEGARFMPSRVIGADEGVRPVVYVAEAASVIGSDVYVDKSSVYIGEKTVVESGVGIKGPTIIGSDNDIRQGAYLRGDVITGHGCTLRGELKNAVMLDKANFPHPSYVGDSICGYMSHFGNQATAANLGIFEGLRETADRNNLVLRVGNATYDIGTPKMGICLGDYSQVGCNSVSDPGTFLAPRTIVYSLTRIPKGFYGPNEILKNKPMEHGVIERASFEE
jgi:hypothetical protein